MIIYKKQSFSLQYLDHQESFKPQSVDHQQSFKRQSVDHRGWHTWCIVETVHPYTTNMEVQEVQEDTQLHTSPVQHHISTGWEDHIPSTDIFRYTGPVLLNWLVHHTVGCCCIWCFHIYNMIPDSQWDRPTWWSLTEPSSCRCRGVVVWLKGKWRGLDCLSVVVPIKSIVCIRIFFPLPLPSEVVAFFFKKRESFWQAYTIWLQKNRLLFSGNQRSYSYHIPRIDKISKSNNASI